MLRLSEIKQYYPESLQFYERFIIREYLQYKILEIVFETTYKNKLSFMGGTCLRIIHGNLRFSEDLDFDNLNLSYDDFNALSQIIKRELQILGYEVEMRNVSKGAFHCYIRFPELLFSEGLTNHKEEKILIQLDTEPQNYDYTPEIPILNKFDVFTPIKTTPKSLLLAQKFYAVLNRKRNKGRDFYDIVFLLGQGQLPDYNYLEVKTTINSPENLRRCLLERCEAIDLKALANDVKPFLFNPKDEKKVLLFKEYIQHASLG
jgi:predicted nucleotidyltransferase component of viral defense system